MSWGSIGDMSGVYGGVILRLYWGRWGLYVYPPSSRCTAGVRAPTYQKGEETRACGLLTSAMRCRHRLRGLQNVNRKTMGVSQNQGCLNLGVPIIGIIVFWGLYSGPLSLGNYQIKSYTVQVRPLEVEPSSLARAPEAGSTEEQG